MMTTYRVLPHVNWRILEEKTIVVSLQGGAYYLLTGSSKIIWDRLVVEHNTTQLPQVLINQYGITADVAHRDVETFLKDLTDAELIAVVDNG